MTNPWVNGAKFLVGVCVSAVLLGAPAGKPNVVSDPDVLRISNQEGVVEFRVVGLTSRDGRDFKIKEARAENRLVKINGSVGIKVKTQGFLVYLGATLKAGHYTDALVFEIEGAEQSVLRVPVQIDVEPRGDMKQASVQGSLVDR